MKRLIFTIVMVISCTAAFSNPNPDQDKKEILKTLKSDMVRAYDLNAESTHYSKDLCMGYVFIQGKSIWSHLPEYAIADISTVMSKYANIQLITDWSTDKDNICTYSEYQCFLDTNRIYTIILTFYSESNTLSICVYD